MMFKYPAVLWLLTIILPLTAYYVWKLRKANPSMGVSSLSAFTNLPVTWKVYMMHLVFGLEMASLACVIVALANLALVIFAGESLSLMPLTNDRTALVNALENVQPGSLNDGTAIGDGLSSSINRILSGKAKSKSIILLTDGSNNAGDVPPSTAAEIARQKGVKVYTIGVGTNGTIQVQDPYGFSTTTMETKIDEPSLRSIAKMTGGKYFRAADRSALKDVFAEIDSLEKTTLDVNRYTRADEDFMKWALAAVVLYATTLILRLTLLRRLP